MGLLSKEQLRELIKEKHLVTADDVQNMLKEMFAETLQEMLEAELDTELGYPKNGSSPEGRKATAATAIPRKSVRSQYGELEIEVPRRIGRGILNRPLSRSIRRMSPALKNRSWRYTPKA